MHYEVQTILFHKDDYDIKKAKKWLKDHEYKYISHDEIDFYIRFTLTEQNFLKYKSHAGFV